MNTKKKQNELLHNASPFLTMELWRPEVHVQRDILCTVRAQRAFFHFDRLYLMTHVSFGDRKGANFLSFDSSFMWCEQFYQEELFILTIFTL